MLSRFARSLVAKFLRLAPWIEEQELTQVACLAALEARRHYKPDMGASLSTYQAAAIRYMLSHCLDRERAAPVQGTLSAIRHTRRADLDSLNGQEDDRALPDLDLATARARLRAILQRAHPAATAVLLEERKPAEVARAMRLPVGKVYQAVLYAKRAVVRDEGLRQLMAS